MHNLHLIVVKAEDVYEAYSLAEDAMMDFGDENNWRTVGGSLCVEDGVIHISDETSRFLPDEDSDTLDKINKKVRSWLEDSFYGNTAKIKLEKTGGLFNPKDWTKHELWSLEKYVKYLYEIADIDNPNEFDVLTDTFYAYQFDVCGVTHVENEVEDGKTYIVFVDMHS